jgi:Pyruvate/2-oxoacid:ferredoxin oxidoreductase delta subunit
MNVLIHYFSGTGNARRAAQLLASWYERDGDFPMLHNIEDGPLDTSADLHIFLNPVYAMGLPHIMQRFLHRTPKVEGEKAAVIVIYGEISAKHTIPGHSGYSYWKAEQILRGRGYDVVWTDGIGYPENLTAVGNPPTAEDIAIINREGDARLKEIYTGLRKGKRHLMQPKPWVFWVSIPFEAMFQNMGRRVIGQAWAANCACTGCGFCAKICPAQTIRIRHGRPEWGLSCEGCMRCINECPQKSIQLSLVRAAVTLLPLGALAGLLSPFSKRRNRAFHELWKGLGGIILTLIVWKLLTRLGRVPKWGRLTRINYTHKLRRYRAEPIIHE